MIHFFVFFDNCHIYTSIFASIYRSPLKRNLLHEKRSIYHFWCFWRAHFLISRATKKKKISLEYSKLWIKEFYIVTNIRYNFSYEIVWEIVFYRFDRLRCLSLSSNWIKRYLYYYITLSNNVRNKNMCENGCSFQRWIIITSEIKYTRIVISFFILFLFQFYFLRSRVS